MKTALIIILSLGFYRAHGFISIDQGIQEIQTESNHELPETLLVAEDLKNTFSDSPRPPFLIAGLTDQQQADDSDNFQTSSPLLLMRRLTYDMVARLMAAESDLLNGNLESALEKYMEVALETRDSSIVIRTLQLAKLSGDQNKIDKAIELQSEVDPRNIQASLNLVPFLVRSGNVDGAVEHLKLVIEQIPNSSSSMANSTLIIHENVPFFNLRHSTIPLPDPKKKLNALEQNEPSFENILGAGFRFAVDTLSKFLRGEGEHKEAAINTMKGLSLEYEKENVEAQMALALFLSKAEQPDEALKVAESVTAFATGNTEITIFRSKLYQEINEDQKALDVLAGFLRHHPNSETIHVLYASMLIDMEQYEKAGDEFKQLLRKYPDNSEIDYFFGLMLWKTDQLDRAKQQFEKLVSNEEFVDMANYSLGQITESQEQYDKARDFYEKIKHQDFHIQAQIKIAGVIAKKGDIESARAHLYGIRVESSMQLMSIASAEADILMNAGQYDEMIEAYKRTLTRFPGDFSLLTSYIKSTDKINRVDINIIEAYVNNILSYDPDNAVALNYLGYSLVEYTDRYDEAYGMINRALQLIPNDPSITDSLGWVLFKMGRPQEALEHLERASSLMRPEVNGETEAHVGEVYWTLGRKEKARRVWNRALEKADDKEYLIKTMKRLDSYPTVQKPVADSSPGGGRSCPDPADGCYGPED